MLQKWKRWQWNNALKRIRKRSSKWKLLERLSSPRDLIHRSFQQFFTATAASPIATTAAAATSSATATATTATTNAKAQYSKSRNYERRAE